MTRTLQLAAIVQITIPVLSHGQDDWPDAMMIPDRDHFAASFFDEAAGRACGQ